MVTKYNTKTGFIGAGRTGTSMAGHLASKGVEIAGFYDIVPAKSVFKPFPSAAALAEESDVIFITVPDSQIKNVWAGLKTLSLKNKLVIHTSGALTSAVFDGIDKTGAAGCSAHPVYAISAKNTSLENVPFTIEGNTEALQRAAEFFNKPGNPVFIINPENKPLYHAACVVLSNLAVALAKTGADLFAKAGLPQDAWKKLFSANAENIINKGITGALTGPVERGDAETIKKHLSVLNGDAADIYRSLSLALLPAAKEKHPHRNYDAVENILKK